MVSLALAKAGPLLASVDWAKVITALVALYGAALSTYNFFVQWNDRRPRLNVKPKVVVWQPGDATPWGGRLTKNAPVLCVHFANPTSWRVPVTAVFIRPNKSDPIELRQHNLAGGSQPPFVVEPHRGFDFIFHGQELAEKLEKAGIRNDFQATIEAQDELDRCYKSELIHLSTQQLLEV